MHHLILFQNTNKRFRKDSKYVFTPESEALAKFALERGDTVERIGINGNQLNKDAIKADVIDAVLKAANDIDALHFICHGWQTGFQFGFTGNPGARILGSLVGSVHPKYINLYACLTGKNSENFAKWVFQYSRPFYERLVDYYPRLVCHSTKGHATQNPNVKTYFADDNKSTQSCMVYTKTHKLYWIWWFLLWTTDLKFEFPFIEKEEIATVVNEASERPGIWSDMKKLRKKVLKF